MGDALVFLSGVLLGYALKSWRVREQERELSAGMREVARLTARLNKATAEAEQVHTAKARLN